MPRVSGSGIGGMIPGVLVVGTKQLGFIAPTALTLHHVETYVDSVPTGTSILVDVNINLVTVFTTQANRPTIAANTKVGSRVVPDIQAVAAGDILTVDVDQVGSTGAGSTLFVTLVFI